MEPESCHSEGEGVERPPGPGPGPHDQNLHHFSPQPEAGNQYHALPEPNQPHYHHLQDAAHYQHEPVAAQSYQPPPPRTHPPSGYVFTAPPSRPTNNFIGITPPALPAMLDYQAEQSSSFTQTFLRGILTSIDSKDPVVANAWLETLLDAIDLLPIEVIKQDIINIAIAKSQLSQPPFSRAASCKMLGKLATKLDQQSVRQEVLPPTLALCQDVESDVRNCMCRHLALVARGIGLELTKSAILPVLVELSNDESSDVRLSAIETVVHLLSLLDDDVCNNTIVPLVIKSCDQARTSEDCTLPVIARHLGRLCHGLTPNLSPDQKAWFITFYQQLSKLGTTSSTEATNPSKPMPDLVPRDKSEDKGEKYVECRQACAYNLPGMVLFVGSANFTDKLFSTFCDFATDPSHLVRKTLATSLHELIKIIGTNFSLSKMQVVALFNDNNVDVLSAMVVNMVYVIDALARFGVLQFGSCGSYSQDLSLAILHMEEVINSTRNWRLHADCLEKLSCLANCISATVIQQRYIPLLFLRAHKSRPLPCRVASVRTLLVILRFTVRMEDRVNIMERVRGELAGGKSCHSRMLFLKMCEMAVMLFSRTYFKQHFFSELLSLSEDSVANIRLKVVSLLPVLKALLSLPVDLPHLQHLEETVKGLMVVEGDRDVLAALHNSIVHLAEIETGPEGTARVGATVEEERDDDRKLREERLIANMEEQIKQVQGAKFEQLVAPSAIPSRLLDRKRSESLPPALSRADLPSLGARPRYSSPEPQIFGPPELSKQGPPKPSYSQEIAQRNIWQSEAKPEEKEKKQLATPYSSSLENLDPSTQEFLVDAGIKLPTTTGHMTSAASMPNLTSIGKVKDQIVRSNSIPDNSNIDGELAKYLISNEEMEHYEAEYHKAVTDTPSPSPPPAPASPLLRPRGRTETRLRPPSFTSALTGIKTPPPAPAQLPLEILEPEPTKKPEVEKVKVALEESKPALTKSRSSPPKDEMTRSQKWNDGSVERLAEKWAAKRDTLLKETGALAENLQQRKVAMEQRLESVKRSIPKRSLGFTPQSAQKRLSLCESVGKNGKSEMPTREIPKRKSMDIDLVIPPDADDSDPEDSLLTKKLSEIRRGSPQRKIESPRKPSPEVGSSDSDDSLPPYPAVDRPRLDLDRPLPPPPPVIEPPAPSECLPAPAPEPLPPPPSHITTKQSPKVTKQKLPAPSTVSPGIAMHRPSLLSSALSSRSSLVTYKTVSAPLTSVAVSRTLQAPQRGIADSPRLPFKKLPQKTDASTKINSFQKVPVPDKKTTTSLASSNPVSDKSVSSPGGGTRGQMRPAASGSRLQGPGVPGVRGPHSSMELPAAPPQKPDTNSSDLSAPSTGKDQQKRLSKIATTQISAVGSTDSSFSTFKGKTRPGDKPRTNGTKTIIYIEGPQKGPRLQGPPTIHQARGLPRQAPSPQIATEPPHNFQSHPAKRASSPQRVASPNSWQAPSPQFVQSPPIRRAKSPFSVTSAPSLLGASPHRLLSARASSPQEGAKLHLQAPGRAVSVENLLGDGPASSRTLTRVTPPRDLAFTPATSVPSLRSPSQLSPTSSKPRPQGPRRSSGVRMWAGSRRLPGAERRSPTTSRSPSPATRAAAGNVPGRLAEPGHSLTLPRAGGMSRLRAPASPQVSQGSQQRRSYGGLPSYQGPGPTKFPSAPTTPRHSQGDLTDSRSSSPVTARRRLSGLRTPSSSQPGTGKPGPPAASRLGAPRHPSLRPQPPAAPAPPRGGQPAASPRPSGLTAQLTTFSAVRAPSIPTPLTARSRLPNPHKGFGYNQNN